MDQPSRHAHRTIMRCKHSVFTAQDAVDAMPDSPLRTQLRSALTHVRSVLEDCDDKCIARKEIDDDEAFVEHDRR